MAASLEFCRKLPKVELHAHLNGSISSKTMTTLLDKKARKLSSQGKRDTVPQVCQMMIDKGEQRELASAFEMFKIIHSVVDDEEALRTAASDVVMEFAEDNVKYLELRTTPRANSETGMTKRSYIDAVIAGINDGLSKCSSDIAVRLLLSIDRCRPISEAYETLRLSADYRTSGQCCTVVGMDLSGDPKAGCTGDIVAILTEARRQGMKLSIHLSERANSEDDTEQLLAVPPDRIGHGTYLHRGPMASNSPLVTQVLEKRIPIEICMTSNLKAQTVSTYDQHHLKFWMSKHHPCIICTDDKGVFATSLSEEYHIASKTFGLSEEYLTAMSKNGLQYIFDEDLKHSLTF